MGAAVVALFSGQDVDIAIKTANNAIDNNLAVFLVPYLTAEAVIAFLAMPQGQALIVATGLTLYQFSMYLKECYQSLDMDALDEKLKEWQEIFAPEESKAKVNSTPFDSGKTQQEGYQSAPSSARIPARRI
jgi:hypothetical protein